MTLGPTNLGVRHAIEKLRYLRRSPLHIASHRAAVARKLSQRNVPKVSFWERFAPIYQATKQRAKNSMIAVALRHAPSGRSTCAAGTSPRDDRFNQPFSSNFTLRVGPAKSWGESHVFSEEHAVFCAHPTTARARHWDLDRPPHPRVQQVALLAALCAWCVGSGWWAPAELLSTGGLGMPEAAAAEVPQRVAGDVYRVGLARVEITPEHPVRLNGFGFRREESAGVRTPLHATALAFFVSEGPVLLMTVESTNIPAAVVRRVADALQQECGLHPQRLTVAFTHTHTAPMLTGMNATLFGEGIPQPHQEHIDRYTEFLVERLIEAGRRALREPFEARLGFGIGSVGFAVNRRTSGGPVDHDLPLLAVYDLEGRLRAVLVTYACHCVTLSDNLVSGDWAGYALAAIEARHEGVLALVAIGCGADANPDSGVTGDRADLAEAQGRTIAAEVDRLLGGFLAPLAGELELRSHVCTLPLAELPTRAELEARAALGDARGYHARLQLARLDAGQALPSEIEYTVQAWTFGDSLALVFLPGEVVVDYALRLKREFDRTRVVVVAYANDAPCYIPSERVLAEGGYEGGDAMVYYDLPAAFRPGLEEIIITAVQRVLPEGYRAPYDPARVSVPPLSPQQAGRTLHVAAELAVELVAAEPLVVDPVAIDFGADGRLWVCEMHDYPEGTGGNYEPGGRVRVLEDRDGDGRYDTSTLFLDGLSFPTGLSVWKDGVLVCAAPDILFAVDTDGDGRADRVETLVTGFATHNYQARVNSLAWGLDGWLYGSGGLFGGVVSLPGREPLEMANRDFRLHIALGRLEPAAGRSQQGRVRDDWDNWFGCDSGTLIKHYPLAEHYLRRNPHYAAAGVEVHVPGDADTGLLYPARDDVQIFALSGPARRVTSACGLGLYRDELLGQAYAGNAFVCEPVHLVVHRLVLEPRGATFVGRRAAEEASREFLAGTDRWFRPVQVRTGPDGALWIVDMYRYVIEHPRWIPVESLAALDVRAGDRLGRIWRVVRRDAPPRPMPRLAGRGPAELAAMIDTPNGTVRDLACQFLLWHAQQCVAGVQAASAKHAGVPPPANQDTEGQGAASQVRGGRVSNALVADELGRAQARLAVLARSAERPAVRAAAAAVLDGMGMLDCELVGELLVDPHPGVRRQALRMAESRLDEVPKVSQSLDRLADDADAQVRLQLAYTLGARKDPQAARLLARLLLQDGDDPQLRSAAFSSISDQNIEEVLRELRRLTEGRPPAPLLGTLLEQALLWDHRAALVEGLDGWRHGAAEFAWGAEALRPLLVAAGRRGFHVGQQLDAPITHRLEQFLFSARERAADEKAELAVRLAALALLGWLPEHQRGDLELAGTLLSPQSSAELQHAALDVLGRTLQPEAADIAIDALPSLGPATREAALDVLMSRTPWTRRLLHAVAEGQLAASMLSMVRQQVLRDHSDPEIRALAAQVLVVERPDLPELLQAYRRAAASGVSARGRRHFARHCAGCHRLAGMGHSVGPDLAGLTDRSAEALLVAVLDPNRAVDQRFLMYTAITQDGRVHQGLLASETATSLTLRAMEGKELVLLRSDLESLTTSGKSLMPEGLERELPPADAADLVAWLAAAVRAEAVARQLLDEGLHADQRVSLANQPGVPADLVVAGLVQGMQPGADEYVRIPWIWRVGIHAARRNEAAELLALVERAIPAPGEPLADWQAVVLGGAVINGLTQAGVWPDERLAELFAGNPDLQSRWERAIDLAFAMAADERVPTGTRYDALRMIGLAAWERARPVLEAYLAAGVHDELQMGAISALGDVRQHTRQAGCLLLENLAHYSDFNRRLALDLLMRDADRMELLLDALAEGTLNPQVLTAEHIEALRSAARDEVRRRAQVLLP